MSNKDFLSQFSNENKKPASFNEEVRTPVQKDKKPINPWFLIIPAIVVLTAGVILYLIFLRPNIVVANFVGAPKDDAVAWIRQQGIDTSGIVFKEEYNFDIDDGNIVAQDPDEGKITPAAKMTFVVSKGADPDEQLPVPDFESMTKEDINDWIKKNKLQGTKINTTYSETVPTGDVINADFVDCEESTFTRGCSLKISISKGPKPADEIEMINFSKKSYDDFEAWCLSKKVVPAKVEKYSDTVPKDQIIAQSIKEKEFVKVGETVTVTVSKGEAVKMEDFVGKSYSIDFNHWKNKHSSVSVLKREAYSSDYTEGDIISQSIKPGVIITTDLEVVVSKGEPILEKTLSSIDINELRAWRDEVNNNGAAGISVSEHSRVPSESVPAGNIVEIYGATKIGANKYKVPVGTNLKVVISKGEEVTMENFVDKSYTNDFNPWLAKHQSISVITKEQYSSSIPNDIIISQSVNPGTVIKTDLVITVSLGEPCLNSLNTMNEYDLQAWVDEVNAKDANIQYGTPTQDISDKVGLGKIISVEGAIEKNNVYFVSVGSTLNPTISKGKYIYLGKTYKINEINRSWDKAVEEHYSEGVVRELGELSGVNYEIQYDYNADVGSNRVIKITLNDNPIDNNDYASESDKIIVTICDKSGTIE